MMLGLITKDAPRTRKNLSSLSRKILGFRSIIVNQCQRITSNDKLPIANFFDDSCYEMILSLRFKNIDFLQKNWCIVIILSTSIAN